MSDEMKVQSFDVLLNRILREYEANESVFGIHRSQFYAPQTDAPFTTDIFGQHLATPIGPAAGPHTQLTQNILAAWLTGGRFIELKTVQKMDELEIPRPCIDLEDEGYNVEWSQELKLDLSAGEYVKAWVLLRVLRRLLGWEDVPLGTVFNMSVGYNLEGIRSAPMQRFMTRLEDASEEIARLRSVLRERFPQFADVEVPDRLTNSVTLSTMHGCPPDEIEAIARYMLEERGLHTFVKLNPTLLGKEDVLGILHDRLGFHEIQIPDRVFEHDLRYERAMGLIRTLQEVAAARGLTFGVKLSNTLAVANHRSALPGDEMYMSGRALYPITINLFHKLIEEFDGQLEVSFSAGADAKNVATILACGARTVTAASDLLKPGGYGRLTQWLEELSAAMKAQGASSLEELARTRRTTLAKAAAAAPNDPRYRKSYFPYGLPKVASALEPFDCIAAPCVEQCAVCQDVPEYAWEIARGRYDRALEVILQRNPLPGITGYVCTHLCQTRCTRANYDQPVAIRALKRFAVQHGTPSGLHAGAPQSRKVAIVGSGPAGLAAAYFLGLNGVRSTVFEARDVPGGMCAIAPHFRIPQSVVQADVERITALGAERVLDHRVDVPPAELMKRGFDAVFLATGFQRDATLEIDGIQGPGVFTALRFLEAVARGDSPALGGKVLVIGGGNTAMDAARSAQRLTGKPSTVVYRRTLAEMPAEKEELTWLFEEGNELIELASPVRVLRRDGRVVALECLRNELGAPDADGRRKPLPVPGSEFKIECDAVILAIGQQPDVTFLDGSGVSFRRDGALVADPETGRVADGLYAGGDLTKGPDIIIGACADGRRAAEAICRQFSLRFEPFRAEKTELSEADILQVKRARTRKTALNESPMLPVAERTGFACVEQTLDEAAARAEASRCLQCSTVCDKCVEVCPNRANYTYRVEPVSWGLTKLMCRNGMEIGRDGEVFRITQTRQIVHVDDFCNECGNCATFCVHQGRPYADKPRLFLTEAGFLAELDNAFFIQRDTIRRREGGREASLTLETGGYLFQDDRLRVSLSHDWSIRKLELAPSFDGIVSLRTAAEMALLLRGVRDSVSFLLI